MTKRRQILNKINKRIQTVVNRTGVDIDILHAMATDVDHVYVTRSGNLNVDAADWTDDIGKALERRIKTYLELSYEVAESVDKELSTFIGPVRPNERNIRIARDIKAKLEVEDELDEFFQEYYDTINVNVPFSVAMSAEYLDFQNQLSDLGGKISRQEATYVEIQEIFNQAKDLMETFR